jgi:RNA polymerase sigma factor (sigma-70 family)
MVNQTRDLALLWRWRTRRDCAARAEIVRRCMPQIERAATRQAPDAQDDYVADASVVLLRAIDEYDLAGRVPFRAYVARRIDAERRDRHAPCDIDVDRPSGVQDSPEEFAIASETRRLRRADLIEAIGALTDREAEVVSRRYLGDDDVTLADVARQLGMSRERARQIEANALAKLRRLMRRDAA